MTTLSASRLRIPPKTFDDVVYNGERVKVTHLGGKELYLISKEDMELLQAIENSVDGVLADEVIERIKKGEEKTIAWQEAKKELGL